MEEKWLYEELTHSIIGAAMEVHKILGTGFLEYVYEEALCYELKQRGINFDRQEKLEIFYKAACLTALARKDWLIPKKI